jgi:hypothetical protein
MHGFIVVAIHALAITSAHAHLFVVELKRVVDGTFVGSPGYPRAYGISSVRHCVSCGKADDRSQSYDNYIRRPDDLSSALVSAFKFY